MVKKPRKDIKLYVEGGGDTDALRSELRRGMSEFLKKLNWDRMPAIVACGGRKQAYDRFCTAMKQGKCAFLLVDSEGAVANKHLPLYQNLWVKSNELLG